AQHRPGRRRARTAAGPAAHPAGCPRDRVASMPDFPTLPPVAAEPISALLLAPDPAAPVEEGVGRWAAEFDGRGRDYELLLLLDRDADPEGTRSETLVARHPRLRVLCPLKGRGVGALLRAGVAAAGLPLLFYPGCDPQYQPADLKLLLGEIDKVHLVAACRTGRRVPAALRWLGRLYRGAVRVLFGVPLEPLPGWLGWKGQALRWAV